jgi:uroporphyrinogen-III synthase
VDGSETSDPTEFPVRRGPRALVTRPREEAQDLAVALAERGISVLVEPLMQVHFRASAAPDLEGVQAVLCTSANGVRALARVTDERRLPLLAVGDATAARARAEGFTGVASAGGAVADLVDLAVARLRPQGGRLVHVAGDFVAGDLVGALQAHGFMTERSILYEARPAAALSEAAVHALRCGAIDFAIFFSPRTATIFVGLAGLAGISAWCHTITTFSISAAADAPLAGLPWRDRWVAEKPNQQGLLDRLDRVLGERRQG